MTVVWRCPARAASCWVPLALAAALGGGASVAAQTVDEQLHILRLEATPIGALPQMAMPMPASRNHNYWGIRLQVGQRRGRGGPDLQAIAGGIDLQWRGGSVFGLTGGYQERDCELAGADCGGHALFGLRGRFNVISGGPTIGAALGDYSATTTLGTEVGFGYAPEVMPDLHACTFDIGVPISLAMLQRVRLVSYITPAVVWDIDCSEEGPRTRASFLTALGLGVQQIGIRGLDAYLGFQKIFRGDTGYQFGLSVTYVRLP